MDQGAFLGSVQSSSCQWHHFLFFAPNDMFVALTTECTWQFVGELCLRLMCFASSAHVWRLDLLHTRRELRFFLFVTVCSIVFLVGSPRISVSECLLCVGSCSICVRQVFSGWFVLRWFPRLVLKRFPFVPSSLNDCVDPHLLTPAVG